MTICGTPLGLPPAMGSDTDMFFDEIHPSSYGMGLVTNGFIEVMNAAFETSLSPLSTDELNALAGLECTLTEGEDTDGDGVADDDDNCPSDSNFLQIDADDDGAGDECDACPNDPDKVEPGVCGCDAPDDDTDGDGTLDCNDGCPDDPSKIDQGACGCGVGEDDGDGDGTLDCTDGCPDDQTKTDPGACGCGQADVDADADGVADCVDNCPDDVNADQADEDGDGRGDACESPTRRTGGFCGAGMIGLFPFMFSGLIATRLAHRRRHR